MWLFPPYRLDVTDQRLWRDDASIPLMPKPFAVLQYLVERAGRLITQDELLAAIWPDTHVQPDVLRRYILEVRRALGDQAETPRFIETLPKRGYRFIAPATQSVAPRETGVIESSGAKLVGRESAISELEAYLMAAMHGQRQVVFVSGEAGIGKTSLLQAFTGRIDAIPGVHAALGQCAEGFGGKEPYYPLLEAVGRLLRGPAKTLVANALEMAAPTWMIQFPAMVRAGEHAKLQRSLLGATRERMVRELCEALEIVTQGVALVLIFEDLHWIDNSSLDILSVIARRREPAKLLLIASVRPVDLLLSESPLKRLKQDLLSHRLARELALEGLTQADVEGYIAGEFASGDLPREFAAVIHRRSEGNPLFITAMLDHLVQTGVLNDANGSWRLTVPVDRIDPDVPESLKQMLDLQMGHLSDVDRRVLECASVAGQQFTICSVAIMIESTVPEVEPTCASLVERQFLNRSGTCELPSGVLTVEYEFKHSLYREALYRGLPIIRRVNLHRTLAEGLVAFESPSAPVLAAKIAVHFEEGRRYEPAIQHLMAAAQVASRRYAHREAMAVLEHARALISKAEPRNRPKLEREILTRIANTHYTLGEMQLSLDAYGLLAARASQFGDRESEADALMALSHPASFVDPQRAISACERSAQIGAEIQNPALIAQAQLLSACWKILVEGWNEEAGQTCDLAVSTLIQLGAEMPAYGRSLYARVLVYRSEYAKAIENAERALQELTGGDRLWAAPAALYAKASALGHLGRLGESQKTLTTAFELARKDNNAEWIGALRYTSFWVRWHTFDLEEMRRIASDISQAGPYGLSLQMQLQLRIAQGFAELADEKYDTAKRHFEAVLDERTHAILLWRSRMFARRGLSETWLSLGELARARAEADQLTASVCNSRDLYMAAFAWEFSARLGLESGAWERAEQEILRALEVLEKAEIPVAAWRVHATAWKVYLSSNHAKAESERHQAESIIFQIAKSLDGLDSLRDSFLSANPVRRVLGAKADAAPY